METKKKVRRSLLQEIEPDDPDPEEDDYEEEEQENLNNTIDSVKSKRGRPKIQN
jgi:hypothetical protein